MAADDRESITPETVPGATLRGIVRGELGDILDALIPEVQQTTDALRRHKSDYPEPPPETQPSGRMH